jgi:hypothetical protein
MYTIISGTEILFRQSKGFSQAIIQRTDGITAVRKLATLHITPSADVEKKKFHAVQ